MTVCAFDPIPVMIVAAVAFIAGFFAFALVSR